MKDNKIVPTSIGKWTIIAKLGEGSFGSTYSAKQITSSKNEHPQHPQQIAIKTQLLSNIKQMVLLQYKIYKQLQGVRGFPKVYEYVEEDRFSYLAMEKLQVTLDKFAAGKFPNHFLPTVILLQIMLQILLIIENLHIKGYLYRDFKPANLMLKPPYQQIFIIDLGLCKKYLTNNRHILQKKNKKIIGTPIFCSLATHGGTQQSRRDDLQSWIYICLFFSLELPWENIINKKDISKQMQNQYIYQSKKNCKWEQIIKDINGKRNHHMKVPICINKIMERIQQLSFEQQPKYQQYQKIIKNQYQTLTGKTMEDYVITWQFNTNNQIQKLSKVNQQFKKPIQLGKVSKINFKAPLKQKQSTKDTTTNDNSTQKQEQQNHKQ